MKRENVVHYVSFLANNQPEESRLVSSGAYSLRKKANIYGPQLDVRAPTADNLTESMTSSGCTGTHPISVHIRLKSRFFAMLV